MTDTNDHHVPTLEEQPITPEEIRETMALFGALPAVLNGMAVEARRQRRAVVKRLAGVLNETD